jgi:hypothetical protein
MPGGCPGGGMVAAGIDWCIMALSLKAKRNCIVDNFGIIGFLSFGRIPVDSWDIRLTSLFILIVFWAESPKIFYFERFKPQFNPSVRTNWRLTVLKNVAY